MPFAAITSTAPSELGRLCDLLFNCCFSLLGALIQARQNGSGASNNYLDFALVATFISLAISALHLGLHKLLRRLHLPLLLLRPATFFCATAVLLLVTTSIFSTGLKGVTIGVFVSTLFVFLCIRLTPAVFLVNGVAQLRRCKLFKSIFGPPTAVAGNQVESPRNQVSRLEPRLYVEAFFRMVINRGASDDHQFRRLASRQHRPDVCILQGQDDAVVLDMNAPPFGSVSLAEIIEE